MTETEFLTIAGSVLDQIESAFERAGEAADIDVECSRSGNVLEIEFVDHGSKIIVNTQAPMQEIWVAARAGGFHYRLNESGGSIPAMAPNFTPRCHVLPAVRLASRC